jgi:hypothetical protein
MTGQKLLPDDVYEGRVLQPEIVMKEGKEFPTLVVPVRLQHGDSERVLKRFFSYSPNAVWAIQQLLDALDIEYSVETEEIDGEEVESLVFDPEQLEGKNVVCHVTTTTYQGKKRNDIKSISPADD